MKKAAVILSVVSLLGVGSFTIKVNASDQVTTNEIQERIGTNDYCIGRGNRQKELTQEQQDLIEKGYNELTQEEKDLFDTYYRQPKRDLSEDELNEFYKVCDKVHKYMDEDFKAQIEEQREQKPSFEKGQGKGQGSCCQ